MIDKALLTGAFEKMGPERVERGLREHCWNEDEPFRQCFLAMAFGAPGELQAIVATFPAGRTHAMGLTPTEFAAIWRTVDAHHDAFWALANEWLENRPASIRAESREIAGVGACRFGRGE